MEALVTYCDSGAHRPSRSTGDWPRRRGVNSSERKGNIYRGATGLFEKFADLVIQDFSRGKLILNEDIGLPRRTKIWVPVFGELLVVHVHSLEVTREMVVIPTSLPESTPGATLWVSNWGDIIIIWEAGKLLARAEIQWERVLPAKRLGVNEVSRTCFSNFSE